MSADTQAAAAPIRPPLRTPALWSQTPIIFSVVTALALAVRIGVVLSPLTPRALAGDAHTYDELARALLLGQGYALHGHPTAITVPGYPLFLALLYWLFGANLVAVGLVQAALGALTAGLAAVTAMRLAGTTRHAGIPAAWVAGLTVALYPHFLLWTGLALTETLFIALAMCALWLLEEAQSRQRTGLFAMAAFVIAVAVLTRPALLPFAFIAAGVAWWLNPGPSRWSRAALLAIVPLLFAGAWIVWNARTVGVTTLATETAAVLWAGHNPHSAANHRGGYVYGEPLPQQPPENVSEADQYRLMMSAVTSYLASHPLSVVTNVPAKMANMWRPVFSVSSTATKVILGGSYVILMVFGMIGFVSTLVRTGNTGIAFVHWYVVIMVAAQALTIAEIRYRMPIELALAIFAGLAADRILDWASAPSRVLGRTTATLPVT